MGENRRFEGVHQDHEKGEEAPSPSRSSGLLNTSTLTPLMTRQRPTRSCRASHPTSRRKTSAPARSELECQHDLKFHEIKVRQLGADVVMRLLDVKLCAHGLNGWASR